MKQISSSVAIAIFSLLAVSQVIGEEPLFSDGFEFGSVSLIHRWTFSESGAAGTVLLDDIRGAKGSIIEVGTNDAFVRYGQLKILDGDPTESNYAALPELSQDTHERH